MTVRAEELPGSAGDSIEELARERLSETVYEYYAGGADDEVTLTENVAAWRRLCLHPHVLCDVSTVDTATTVLGTDISLPVLVAPMAYQRMAHDAGEAATAEGAAAAGTIMVVPTLSTVSLEDVQGPNRLCWFQIYVHRDRGWTAELVTRAVAAGYRALVLTADRPVLGFRRRDERNGFHLPPGLAMANVSLGDQSIAAYSGENLDVSLSVPDIDWLRSLSGLPVVVKGVLRADDARACVDGGASAVVVSNHGGRQLDTAVATADALPRVVDAVGGDIEVLVDGGIRRGTDVIKALALGARAVLVGRPVLWGLAVNGAWGVRSVLDSFREELSRALTLCGTPTVSSVTPDIVTRGVFNDT